MLKILPIKSFAGFGRGKSVGQYYYSEGLRRSDNGLVPGWSVQSLANSGTLTNLTLPKWFAQVTQGGEMRVFSVSDNGRIFKSVNGFGAPSEVRNPTASSGNGLIGDFKNRLLYARTRYLGMYDGTTWTDDWKDFGADISPAGAYRPMENYESTVLMGNGNKVASLDITTDTFNASAFTLPDGFVVRAIKRGRNGVLLGVNFGNQGILILWDNYSDRSLAPWIWLNSTIQSIKEHNGDWIVITTKSVMFTNGYSISPTTIFAADTVPNSETFSVVPQGAEIIENSLIIANSSARLNRQKAGLMILNLKTGLYEYVPFSGYYQAGSSVAAGAVYYDSSLRTHVGYQSGTYNIGSLQTGLPSRAIYIAQAGEETETDKVAEAVKPDITLDTVDYTAALYSFSVSVKITDGKRQLWTYGTTKAGSTTTTLVVDGTISGINEAEVGDEVTILEGNNAGSIRHITTITGKDTATETWTLDSAVTNSTASGIFFNVSPFKLVKKHTLTSLTELKNLVFGVKSRMKSKHYYVKFLFDDLTTVIPEFRGFEFIYEELISPKKSDR